MRRNVTQSRVTARAAAQSRRMFLSMAVAVALLVVDTLSAGLVALGVFWFVSRSYA